LEKDNIISVVVPAYNAEAFIEKSIESAIHLKEVGEIVIVEDGSKDGTYDLCYELSLKFPKIKLFTHTGRVNRGEAASRNLGIINSKFPLIAFLDADDYYLDHRFKKDVEIFNKNEDVELLYSKTLLKFLKSGKVEDFGGELVDIGEKNNLLKEVFEKGLFLFDVNGVTFKRKKLLEFKLFDERLKLHADTELWWRLMREMKFKPSELIFPVAVAVRHDENSINSKNYLSEFKLITVYIENIGLNNLYDFEKKFLIYKISRILSNLVHQDLMRRVTLHSIQLLLMPIKNLFLSNFFRWGLKYFNLEK
jgi:glycosyltransferase involved in cell wall biosynthesis